MALKGPKAIRKDSIDSKSNAHLHKQQKPKRIFSLWIILVFDTSHSEEDCYWQDIICKRKSERRKWQNRSALICLHSQGSLLKEKNTRIIKDGAFTVDLEWEFIRHNLVLVNRKDFQKLFQFPTY